MNKFFVIAVALVLGVIASRFVRGEEVGSVSVSATGDGIKVGVNAGPSTPAASTAQQKWAEAEARREQRQAEAARRAGLGFWEARQEDVTATWSGVKWGVCQAARGTANADGYVAAAVAFPTGYVAGSAFSAAASCAQAADSIR